MVYIIDLNMNKEAKAFAEKVEAYEKSKGDFNLVVEGAVAKNKLWAKLGLNPSPNDVYEFRHGSLIISEYEKI